MTYGLTEDGFLAKRLADIQQELIDLLTAQFGELDTSADSVIGQLVGVFSKPLADLWEQTQQIYNSQYPDTAEGLSLDYAVALTGITRQPATFSQGIVWLKGTAGTVVPALTQMSTEATGYLFQTRADATIAKVSAISLIVKIDAVEDAASYTVQVGANFYNYTANAMDTPTTVATALATAAAADTQVTVEDFLNGAFIMTSKSTALDFDVSGTLSDSISWWTPTGIIALDKGAIPAPVNSIINIVTPVSGLDEVRNFVAIDENSNIGRDAESDDDLRLRRIESLKVSGSASVEAIRARILTIGDVEACFVLENVTDVVDINGLDPHSIKVIVSDGVDLDIGKMIWQAKAGGIKVMGGVGSVSVTFTDSQGNLQTISFFRPTAKYAYVNVDVLDVDAELVPSGYLQQIADKVLAWGQAHTIGQELIYQQLFGVVYQVPGIVRVDIQIALMDDDITPPVWQTDNISVSQDKFAEFATGRITVQDV